MSSGPDKMFVRPPIKAARPKDIPTIPLSRTSPEFKAKIQALKDTRVPFISYVDEILPNMTKSGRKIPMESSLPLKYFAIPEKRSHSQYRSAIELAQKSGNTDLATNLENLYYEAVRSGKLKAEPLVTRVNNYSKRNAFANPEQYDKAVTTASQISKATGTRVKPNTLGLPFADLENPPLPPHRSGLSLKDRQAIARDKRQDRRYGKVSKEEVAALSGQNPEMLRSMEAKARSGLTSGTNEQGVARVESWVAGGSPPLPRTPRPGITELLRGSITPSSRIRLAREKAQLPPRPRVKEAPLYPHPEAVFAHEEEAFSNQDPLYTPKAEELVADERMDVDRAQIASVGPQKGKSRYELEQPIDEARVHTDRGWRGEPGSMYNVGGVSELNPGVVPHNPRQARAPFLLGSITPKHRPAAPAQMMIQGLEDARLIEQPVARTIGEVVQKTFRTIDHSTPLLDLLNVARKATRLAR